MLKQNQSFIGLDQLSHGRPIIKEATLVDVGHISQSHLDKDVLQGKEPIHVDTVHLKFQQNDLVGVVEEESTDAPQDLAGRYRPNGADAVAEYYPHGWTGANIQQEGTVAVFHGVIDAVPMIGPEEEIFAAGVSVVGSGEQYLVDRQVANFG